MQTNNSFGTNGTFNHNDSGFTNNGFNTGVGDGQQQDPPERKQRTEEEWKAHWEARYKIEVPFFKRSEEVFFEESKKGSEADKELLREHANIIYEFCAVWGNPKKSWGYWKLQGDQSMMCYYDMVRKSVARYYNPYPCSQ